jgi:hypothetical protein
MTKTPTKAEFVEAYGQERQTNILLEERLAELELALEDTQWLKLSLEGGREFSREGLAKIIQLSELMARKNPLINHAVAVTSDYVFGQGVSLHFEDERLNGVWQAFWDDPKNQSALTDHRALIENEQELETTGNLFYALFTNISSGRVRVRSIPVDDVQEIICNPDDAKEPWYYKRVWTQRTLDMRFRDSLRAEQREAFYPDVRYWPASRPASLGSTPVMWDSPVYHVKVGGSAKMKFGVPEVYPALDWARAAKEALEDYATTHRALARFAWSLTTKGGGKGVAAAKTKLGTTLAQSASAAETNPPPVVGSTFIASEGVDMKPIQTRGMAPAADEGRALWLMVAAGVGIPHTILAGDADVGNLATAKTLDRPTELKMRSRQQLWSGIFSNLSAYVLMQAVLTASGPLRGLGSVAIDASDNSRSVVWGNDVNPHLDVDWPELLERDTDALVSAIVKAATLDGKPSADLFDAETVARMLLRALGEDEIDELLAQQDGNANATEAAFGTALRDVRELVEAGRNGHG